MNPRSIAFLTAGLALLLLAALQIPSPRLSPRPDLPEIPPFAPGERIALLLPDPDTFPPPENLALVQRARAAGAQVHIFAPGESPADFFPTRLYRANPRPYDPPGYHPDQWPAPPPPAAHENPGWQMLVLTPEETAARNAAVLAAARRIRESGTDTPRGDRELAVLSRARRAELYTPLP